MKMFKRLSIFLTMLFAVSFLTACDSSGGDSDSVPAAQGVPGVDVVGCPTPQVKAEDGACICPADVEDCVPKRLTKCSIANHGEWTGTFSSPPETMTVSCDNDRPVAFSIKLNGLDVTEQFDLNDTGASISGEKLGDMAKNAANTVAVTPAGANASATFTFDKLPPRVIITGVEIVNGEGRKLPAGEDMLLVTGVVRDVSDVVSVSINGVEAELAEDESFSVEIDNTDVYVVTAEDEVGQRSSLSYATHTKAMDSSLAIQINKSMMDFVLPMVTDILADFTLPVDAKEKAIKYSGGLCIGGTCVAAFSKLNLGASDDADPSIDVFFAPVEGGEGFLVDVFLAVPKIEVGFANYATYKPVIGVGNVFLTDNWYKYPALDVPDVVIDDATIAIKMKILLDEESGEYKLVLDDDWMNFQMGNMSINDLRIDCNYENPPFTDLFTKEPRACLLDYSGDEASLAGISAFLANPLFNLMDAMHELINDSVFPQIGDQLEAMAVSDLLPGSITLDLDKDGEIDAEIKDLFTLSAAAADKQGNASLEMGTHFFVEEDSLVEGYQGALGSVYNEVIVPAMPSTIDGGQNDLGIAVSANMINQVLLNMYQTAVLDSVIEIPMTPADLCDFATLLVPFGISPDHLLRIRMKLGAVPYMLLDDADGSAGINVQLDNVIVYMDYKGPEEDDYSVMMAFVTDITAVMKIGLNSDNTIELDLDNLVAMDVIEVLKEGLMFSEEFVAYGAIMTPGLIESSMGTVIACMMPAAEELEGDASAVPTLNLDMSEILATDDDMKAMLEKLFPMDIGMILRQFAVDNNDSYLLIGIDLEELNAEQAESGQMGEEQASLVLRLSAEESELEE